MIQRASNFSLLMKKAKWRVCDVRDLAGVDYSTARAWKLGKRSVSIESAAILMSALNKKGIRAEVSDFVVGRRAA